VRELQKINIDASISKKWLTCDEGWSDKFNRLAVLILFGQFIFLPVMLITHEKFTGPNDKIILHWVLPTSILIGLYGIFRGVTEKRLIKISTSLDRQTIKKTILDFAEKNHFEVYRKSNDCIILNSPSNMSINTSHKKTRIFFCNDGLLLFAVIRDNFKVNLPIFFTHYFVKHSLTKLLKKASS
jgi:hypothetical protein